MPMSGYEMRYRSPIGAALLLGALALAVSACGGGDSTPAATKAESPEKAQPSVELVDAAFWCFLGGSVIMIVGGLMAATATFEAARATVDSTVADEQVRSFLTIYQVNGVVSVVAAGALAFLAGRARRGDARFRLATLGLSFAIVVVVVLLAVGIGVMQPLAVLSLLPILAGGALLVVPGVRIWYESEGDR